MIQGLGMTIAQLNILWLRIGASLESGAIVVGAVGIVARGLLLGLLGLGAQRGLARCVIGHLAREHDVAEAGLHGIEFGGGDDVFLPCGQDAGDFFVRIFDALGRRRMRGESLRDGAGAALLVSLDALEESDVGVRVVAGFVHVLDAEIIGFALGIAAELQVSYGDGEVQALIHAVAGPSAGAEKDQRNGGQLHQFTLSGVLGAVPRAHMSNLVGHDSRKLGLFVCAQNQATVHIEEAAGQREGVDFVRIDYLYGEGNPRIGIADEVLADAINIFGDDRVVDQLGRALDFLGRLLAKGDFPLQRVEVNALSDAAAADGFDVFLGIPGSYRVLLLDRLGAALLLRLLLRRRWSL